MSKRHFLPEWHPQWGVLMAWPHPDTDWLENLPDAERCYCEIVSAISQHEKVLLLSRDDSHRSHIRRQLEQYFTCMIDQVFILTIPYNDTWARDFGPLTVLENDTVRILDFSFNAWGDKYAATQDNAINHQLMQHEPLSRHRLESHTLVLEGGSLETDGQGTLLTTEACLLNPNRNPHLSREDIEQQLKKTLGIERVLWLTHGYLEGDDTDAHIDTLARFASTDTIVHMSCSDPSDSHFFSLQAMALELKQFRQANGEAYRLIPIEIPKAILHEGRRLAGSYVNFLIINNSVLLPTYGDQAADDAAIQQMKLAFPKREIVAIDCRPLIEQNGSLHCITMQLPDWLDA